MISFTDGSWRAMMQSDLPIVADMASSSHPDYPEDAAVFAERLELFPQGCAILECNGEVAGYHIAHPGRFGEPVPLDHFLGSIPDDADVLYLHDIALLPAARGSGAASAAVTNLKKLALRYDYDRLALVSVNQTSGFWRGHGFEPETGETINRQLAGYGGESSYMVCDLGKSLP